MFKTLALVAALLGGGDPIYCEPSGVQQGGALTLNYTDLCCSEVIIKTNTTGAPNQRFMVNIDISCDDGTFTPPTFAEIVTADANGILRVSVLMNNHITEYNLCACNVTITLAQEDPQQPGSWTMSPSTDFIKFSCVNECK